MVLFYLQMKDKRFHIFPKGISPKYTYMHTNIYIYIYIYMCVCVCVCVCIGACLYMGLYICACMSVCERAIRGAKQRLQKFDDETNFEENGKN